MRTEMRMNEAQMREEMAIRMSERNEQGDRLCEKWEKSKAVGDGIKALRETNENKARALAFMLENEEAHLSKLTETEISTAFQTTPENVMRIVRLAYPNSVRGDLFLEWGMETARDSIYYLHPVYGSTKRGATAGARILETSEYRYPMEIEVEAATQTPDGSITTFSATLSQHPLRPFTVVVTSKEIPVAVDNGAGVIAGDGISGTVNYATGVVSVTFTTAPAAAGTGEEAKYIKFQYNYVSEVADLYGNIGSVELQLKDYQFRVKPKPLYISWSKMTELLLNTTLNIDAEEALIRGAADEFKKALDFQAVTMGWNTAKGHNAVTFNCQPQANESETLRMNAFSKAVDAAGDVIYNSLLRGGVTKMVGGTKAVNQVMLHQRFDAAGKQPKVGVYKVGSLDGVDIFKAPTSLIPEDEIMCIYKNELVPEDVSIAFGTLVPLYKTQTLEFKELYKESGMASFGDEKVLNPEYLQRIKLTNIA